MDFWRGWKWNGVECLPLDETVVSSYPLVSLLPVPGPLLALSGDCKLAYVDGMKG
jgi:hypothetical protein